MYLIFGSVGGFGKQRFHIHLLFNFLCDTERLAIPVLYLKKHLTKLDIWL